MSVVLYVGFGLIYNWVCYGDKCPGLTSPYWVMQANLAQPAQYLVLLLTGVLSIIPRLCARVFLNTIQPSQLIMALRMRRKEKTTNRRIEQVENRQGFVKFFRSSASDVTVSVSSLSKVDSLNDTEMTTMTNM